MKINKEEFQTALTIVKPGVASKESIIQTTSFCFKDNQIITYNDEISIRTEFKTELEGVVSAKELFSFVSKVRGDEINVEQNENEILLSAGRVKAGIAFQPEIQMPIDEVGELGKFIKLPNTFLEGIKFASGSCSRDMSRPILTNVHVTEKAIEGTDGMRISVFELDINLKGKELLFPAAQVSTIINFNPTYLSIGEAWVHFKKGQSILSVRHSNNDKYVDVYPHLIEDGTEITFPKNMENMIDRSSPFWAADHELDEQIEITLHNKKMTLKAKSDAGWFEEKTRSDYEGEELTFKATPFLLLDILKHTNTAIIQEKKLMFQKDNWKYLAVLRA